MDKLGNNLKQIEKSAQEAHVRATDAENKTIRFLIEVKNLIIPEINVTALKRNTEATKNEAQRIIDEVNKLVEGNEELLDNTKEQIGAAEEFLINANEINMNLGKIMNEAELIKTSASNAVELGDATLNEAQETYNTLSGKKNCNNNTSYNF